MTTIAMTFEKPRVTLPAEFETIDVAFPRYGCRREDDDETCWFRIDGSGQVVKVTQSFKEWAMSIDSIELAKGSFSRRWLAVGENESTEADFYNALSSFQASMLNVPVTGVTCLPSSVLQEIEACRQRNFACGWTPEYNDREHAKGDLPGHVESYVFAANVALKEMKNPHDYAPYQTGRRKLLEAAALIVAEIERLDRARENKMAVAS